MTDDHPSAPPVGIIRHTASVRSDRPNSTTHPPPGHACHPACHLLPLPPRSARMNTPLPSSRSSLARPSLAGPSLGNIPAPLLHRIVDAMTVPDVFQLARTCLRLQDIVYDDARWVRRLAVMGCWNAAEARARDDQVWRARKAARKAGRSAAIAPTAATVLFDTDTNTDTDTDSNVNTNPLQILNSVRSANGRGRAEFARVYSALAPFYADATRPPGSILDRRFPSRHDEATMLAQLVRFSRADWATGCHARRDRLAAAVTMFEASVLHYFELGLDDCDYSGRAHENFEILDRIGARISAIDLFLEKRQYIVSTYVPIQPSDCFDPHSNTVQSLDPVETFFRQVATGLNAQVPVIDKVFPPDQTVFVSLVSRVAETIVADFLSTLFDRVRQQDLPGFITAVSRSFDLSVRLAKSLDQPAEADLTAAVLDPLQTHIPAYLAAELDQFSVSADAIVSEWDQHLRNRDTDNTPEPPSARLVDKTTFMATFKRVVMMPVNAVTVPFSSAPDPSPTTPDPAAQAAALTQSRLANLDAVISANVAVQLTQLAKTAVDRISKFTTLKGDTAEQAQYQCQRVFVALVHAIGPKHVFSGFDSAIDQLKSYRPHEMTSPRPAVEPLVSFVQLVNLADLIQQMVDLFHQHELVDRRLDDDDDTSSSASREKRLFIRKIDDQVAAGLSLGIDVLMAEVEYICSTDQSPTDFNADDGVDIDLGPTKPAARVVDLVRHHISMLAGTTDKSTLDVFNHEVGMRLFGAVCKHIKRQRVTETGAVRVICDVNHYATFAADLRHPDLDHSFAALRQVVQLFLVQGPGVAPLTAGHSPSTSSTPPPDPTHNRSRSSFGLALSLFSKPRQTLSRSDGSDSATALDPTNSAARDIAALIADHSRYGGVFTPQEVYDFAARRADWIDIKPSVERAMYGVGCVVM